uniref:Uncharacterized protein n=1 Tax=Cannabis sativa TaxID=3483 RepID=A0A803PL49_CANSA
MDNKHKKVLELFEKLGVAEDQVFALKEHVISLETEVTKLEEATKDPKTRESALRKNLVAARKKTFDLEESSRDALDKETVVANGLRDQVKVLKKKVTTLVFHVLLDVTFYNGAKSFRWKGFLDT